jgi:hypothetical protein
MGERDIEKKVLELAIPNFDKNSSDHRRLAALSADAHRRAAAYVGVTSLPDSLARKRGMVRGAVSEIIAQIDAVVAGLLA